MSASTPITREYAESFFAALTTRDPEKIAPFVPDDAEWLIVGPIELFPYCGQHIGKAAVLDAYRRMSACNKTLAHVREFLITDGESASALTHLTDTRRENGQVIMVRLAQFARFRDGQVAEFFSIIDTLGAAEQVLGHLLINFMPHAPALVD